MKYEQVRRELEAAMQIPVGAHEDPHKFPAPCAARSAFCCRVHVVSVTGRHCV